MTQRNRLLATAFVAALLGLTACPPASDPADSNASFFVLSASQGGGYLPTGFGWKPNTIVEISVVHEPNGPSSWTTDYKKVLDVTVNSDGMFGFTWAAPSYVVQRTICGSPPSDQKVRFTAKSVVTGRIRSHDAPADLYFTFRPCP